MYSVARSSGSSAQRIFGRGRALLEAPAVTSTQASTAAATGRDVSPPPIATAASSGSIPARMSAAPGSRRARPSRAPSARASGPSSR